jgi:glycosyltransferase involved in cell wall biosynthesis
MSLTVAHVVPNLHTTSGGPAQNVPRLCAALASAGIEIELHTMGAVPAHLTAGVRVDSAAAVWPTRLGRSPGLARGLRASKADLYHAHCLWMRPLGYAAQAAHMRRVPLIISPRGMFARWALRRSPLKKLLAQWLVHPGAFRQAAGWHATSEQEADEIRRLGFRQPICVAPNGIEPTSDDPVLVRATYLRLAPELNGRRIALFFSRLHSKKRPLELLSDFAALAVKHPDWHLLMVGIPEEFDVARLRHEADVRGIAGRVTVLDGRNLPKPYALAELFVLPTHNENFGRVVAEALASGVPVLTTTGTPWSGIEAEGAGRWAPLDRLSKDLDELLALPPSELRAMGERGRRWVLERYDWSTVVRPLLGFYAELVPHGTRS